MSATAAFVVGIVREVISWPSYLLEDHGDLPLLLDVNPEKHPTRNGWIVRDNHFAQNPFTADIDERTWQTNRGLMSLREIAHAIAMRFRDSIRRYADPFSFRLLFSVLRGETASLLDLDDRPDAYDDVGRATRWGTSLPELDNYSALMHDEESSEPRRRHRDVEERLAPPWDGETHDSSPRNDRRSDPPLTPSPRLTRSVYERVFRQLGSGKRLQIGNELLTPVAVKGWYHSIFRTPSGEERMLSIDQILRADASWRA